MKVNSEDWREIQNGYVRYKFKQISKTDDVVTIYDESRDFYLKLSSVDCKYLDQVLYFGSWLTIFVQALSNIKILKLLLFK